MSVLLGALSLTSISCLQGGIVVPNQSSTTLIGSTSYQALVGFNPIASARLSSASFAAVVGSASTSASQTPTSGSFQVNDPFIDAAIQGLGQ